MKGAIAIYGLISGLIMAAALSLSCVLMARDPGFSNYGMWLGWASMLLAFSFIFFAIKSYRDNEPGEIISFGKAFITGLAVAVIASIFYTVAFVIIYKTFYPTFIDEMMSHEMTRLDKSGKSAADILKGRKNMEDMKAMYQTWPGLIGLTMLEVLPLGIVVTLISALILKRKP